MTATGFTAEQRRIVLFRDWHICPICYQRADQVNHRANRGAGGFGGANTLANACAICWRCNGLIESDAAIADLARARGVKLSRYDTPTEVPYMHPFYRMPVLLQDDGDYTFGPPLALPR